MQSALKVLVVIRAAGFEATFYAQGGYAATGTDPFAIPRIGAPPRNILEFILHAEGLSYTAVRRRFRTSWAPLPKKEVHTQNAQSTHT